MKLIVAIVTLIIGLSLTFMPAAANAWEHPHLVEPLPHDVADIPPVEMTGKAAVAVWLDCHPLSCEGMELPGSGLFPSYEYMPAPEALTAERGCYHWSSTEANACALRAFISIAAPVYRFTDMEITIFPGGGYSYLWLNEEMCIAEYFAAHAR